MKIKNSIFNNLETLSGVLIIFAGLMGIVCSSTASIIPIYNEILQFKIFNLISIRDFIHDVLMIIFFLHVALDLKHEMLYGVLQERKQMVLPLFAAIGGMLLPAIIYLLFNINEPLYYQGFGIPCATDIAFAIAIFNLFGQKAPKSIKFFLLAVAIFDDLGAILLIAIFYTQDISTYYLVASFICIVALYIMLYARVIYITLYIIVGAILAYFLHKAGIHTTIAGVLTGLAIPHYRKTEKVDNTSMIDNISNENITNTKSPLDKLNHLIHKWVIVVILPLFAYTACNVNVSHIYISDVFSTLGLGVAVGLFIGKQIGITGFSYIAIRLKLSDIPQGSCFKGIYVVSILGGIGFTMSLFIGELAFPSNSDVTKIGIIMGSVMSSIYGMTALKYLYPHSSIKTK